MKKLFTLIAVASMAFASQANVLTVCDGTAENMYAPFFGLYVDTENTMTQMIYPADMLTDMVGGTINEIRFFAVEGFSSNLNGANLQLALKVVDQTSFEQNECVTGTVVVGNGSPVEGETEMVFVLDNPFVYEGGNLLIETLVTATAGFKSTYFYGVETEEACTHYHYTYAWSTSPYNYVTYFLPKAEFNFTAGEVPPVEPTEKTDAPSSQKVNYVYNDGNVNYNAYTITLTETEPSTIYYRIGVMVDGEYVYGEWMEYTDPFNVNEEGVYMIEAYAVADGKLESDHIFDGFTVSKMVDVNEIMAGKTVAGVRYFNMAGQEMQQANGLTIVVTTYTDGTSSAVKVVK